MQEVIIISSNKDASGMALFDLETFTPISNINSQSNKKAGLFKSCVTDTWCLTPVGLNSASFSGSYSSGDFIAVSQSQKPIIQFYEWNKSTSYIQSHLQEINTSLTSDELGYYLFAGTKNGVIYIWDTSSGQLVSSFKAHFKAINKIKVSFNSQYLISVSEDGISRIWDLPAILDSSNEYNTAKSIHPYRYF